MDDWGGLFALKKFPSKNSVRGTPKIKSAIFNEIKSNPFTTESTPP
jgi:hypothetical protein